eukprot:11403063-Alexandrium_andersonii.AAC.1
MPCRRTACSGPRSTPLGPVCVLPGPHPPGPGAGPVGLPQGPAAGRGGPCAHGASGGVGGDGGPSHPHPAGAQRGAHLLLRARPVRVPRGGAGPVCRGPVGLPGCRARGPRPPGAGWVSGGRVGPPG